MNLLWSIIIGIIAGWIAGMLVRGRGMGIWVNLVVGIVGALIGGFLFNLLGLDASGTLGYLVMSVLGAVILLAIVKAVKRAD